MKLRWRRYVAWYLVCAMFVIGITPRVYAGFSPSEGLGLSPADRTADVKKLQKFLEMKVVGERLKDFGLSPDEIKARLADLSDSQLHELALKTDDLKVGGDGLGIIIALLVIAILIILLIQLTGHRVVVR